MNTSLAVFLINENVRMISVKYEPEEHRVYHFKTMNQDIKKDDYVVIPTNTRHKMTVAQVEDVDVPFDMNSTHDFKWIIDVVDIAGHEQITKMEDEAKAAIRKAEMRKQRETLRQDLLADYEESLKELQMADYSNSQKAIPCDPESADNASAKAKPE